MSSVNKRLNREQIASTSPEKRAKLPPLITVDHLCRDELASVLQFLTLSELVLAAARVSRVWNATAPHVATVYTVLHTTNTNRKKYKIACDLALTPFARCVRSLAVIYDWFAIETLESFSRIQRLFIGFWEEHHSTVYGYVASCMDFSPLMQARSLRELCLDGAVTASNGSVQIRQLTQLTTVRLIRSGETTRAHLDHLTELPHSEGGQQLEELVVGEVSRSDLVALALLPALVRLACNTISSSSTDSTVYDHSRCLRTGEECMGTCG